MVSIRTVARMLPVVAEPVLGDLERRTPQRRLLGVLQLRQVEVGPDPRSSSSWALLATKTPKSNRLAETGSPSRARSLDQVPAARPHEQRGQVCSRAGSPCHQATRRSICRDGVVDIGLTVGHVRPGWRVGVLEIGHEHPAPELRALIIILASVGPVISTRLSARSAGAGGTRHSPARISRDRGRNPAGSVRDIRL